MSRWPHLILGTNLVLGLHLFQPDSGARVGSGLGGPWVVEPGGPKVGLGWAPGGPGLAPIWHYLIPIY